MKKIMFNDRYGLTKAVLEGRNKKVFTTSVPAQIDTTITIKNGVADTLYTYHLTEEK